MGVGRGECSFLQADKCYVSYERYGMEVEKIT